MYSWRLLYLIHYTQLVFLDEEQLDGVDQLLCKKKKVNAKLNYFEFPYFNYSFLIPRSAKSCFCCNRILY